jgi:hypothetical protein
MLLVALRLRDVRVVVLMFSWRVDLASARRPLTNPSDSPSNQAPVIRPQRQRPGGPRGATYRKRPSRGTVKPEGSNKGGTKIGLLPGLGLVTGEFYALVTKT